MKPAFGDQRYGNCRPLPLNGVGHPRQRAEIGRVRLASWRHRQQLQRNEMTGSGDVHSKPRNDFDLFRIYHDLGLDPR